MNQNARFFGTGSGRVYPSRGRPDEGEYEPYEDLANAIVLAAVRDYQHTLITLHQYPGDRCAERKRKELELFFHSEWYRTLTKLDADYLMEKAARQVEERGWKRFFIGYGYAN